MPDFGVLSECSCCGLNANSKYTAYWVEDGVNFEFLVFNC